MNHLTRMNLALLVSVVGIIGATEQTHAQCPMSFAPPPNYFLTNAPVAVAAGDFNADGKIDLVTSHNGASAISILLNAGAGSFLSPVAYPSVWSGTCAVSVDADMDGKVDVVVCGYTTGSGNDARVGFHRGNGDGTFQPMVSYPGGPIPGSATWVATGDFNADGRPDLAVSNNQSSTVSILLNQPKGALFAAPISYATGSSPWRVETADLDADGILDLVVPSTGSNTVSFLRGVGNGTFLPAVPFVAGTGAFACGIGDFNGDGKPDLAVSNESANTVSILLGNGNGTFQAAVNYPVSGVPRNITLADLNADGALDITVLRPAGGAQAIAILEGNGDGTFEAAVILTTGASGYVGPNGLASADLNGDGKPDLAVATANDQGSPRVSVFLNTHSNASAPIILGQPSPTQVVPVGNTAIASVTADGGGATVTYQWRKNGVPIANSENVSGAATETLTINSVQLGDSGLYDVLVKTPACGGGFLTVISQPAVIAASGCSGDINGDGVVNGVDIAYVLGSWGSCE